jgi:uncharacterized membrane protein
LLGRNSPIARKALLALSTISTASSIALAYLMVNYIKSTCVLCVGIYVCSAVNFIASTVDYLKLSKKSKTTKTM